MWAADLVPSMQDHTYFSLTARVSAETSGDLFNRVDLLQEAQRQYWANRTGPLTVAGGVTYSFQQVPMDVLESIGATELMGDRFDQAHVEYVFEPVYYPNNPNTQRYPPNLNESFFSLTAALLAGSSRGEVTLQVRSVIRNVHRLILIAIVQFDHRPARHQC